METKTQAKSNERGAHRDWDTKRKCEAARELESAGDYEGARAALAGVWNAIGERPYLAGLEPLIQSEVLLRVGALSGWLGSSQQVPGAQEFAKDLLGESIRAFDALGDQAKVAEAQTDLAICYWREGAMDEARVWFREALSRVSTPANKIRVLVNSTIVEISSNRLPDAMTLLDQASLLLDHVDDPAALGRYHMQRALVLKRLGGAENLDRALIENTAASVHFEQASHKRYFAAVENNIGFVFLQLGRCDEALHHLDKARRVFIDLRDIRMVAQINETRARVFLAQGQYIEAERTAFGAASALEGGGEQSLLAEALVTQGLALARIGHHQSALSILKRAADIAEKADDLESAGRTFLTMIEELKPFLPASEIVNFYNEADRRLGDQLDVETIGRLRACARLLLAKRLEERADDLMIGGSLEQEVLRYEGELIRRALDQVRGSVTRAAKVLGKTHQGLCYIINTRHKNLLSVRAPVRVRRKSIIKKR
jgi:tetratricopeptide (TPR) repeat protein